MIVLFFFFPIFILECPLSYLMASAIICSKVLNNNGIIVDIPDFLLILVVTMAVFPHDIEFWAEISTVNHVKEVLIYSY